MNELFEKVKDTLEDYLTEQLEFDEDTEHLVLDGDIIYSVFFNLHFVEEEDGKGYNNVFISFNDAIDTTIIMQMYADIYEILTDTFELEVFLGNCFYFIRDSEDNVTDIIEEPNYKKTFVVKGRGDE